MLVIAIYGGLVDRLSPRAEREKEPITRPCVEVTVALTKDKKTALIGDFKTHDKDTGSPEVQVAILSERINYLTEHFKPTARIITRAAGCSSSSASAVVCSTI